MTELTSSSFQNLVSDKSEPTEVKNTQRENCLPGIVAFNNSDHVGLADTRVVS